MPVSQELVEKRCEQLISTAVERQVPKDDFIKAAHEVWGAVGENEPFEDQMSDMGLTVAVLMWNLIQLRQILGALATQPPTVIRAS